MLMGVLMMDLLCKSLPLPTIWCYDLLTNFDDSRPIPFNATLTPRFPGSLDMLQKEQMRLGLNAEN